MSKIPPHESVEILSQYLKFFVVHYQPFNALCNHSKNNKANNSH